LADANPVGLGLALRIEKVDWRLEKLLENEGRWRKMVKHAENRDLL